MLGPRAPRATRASRVSRASRDSSASRASRDSIVLLELLEILVLLELPGAEEVPRLLVPVRGLGHVHHVVDKHLLALGDLHGTWIFLDGFLT